MVTATASCTTDILHPAIKVSKECPAAVESGQDIPFSGTVSNTGETPLDVTVVDDNGTPGDDSDDVVVFSGTLGAGASDGFTGSYTPSSDPSTNTVTATGDALEVTVATPPPAPRTSSCRASRSQSSALPPSKRGRTCPSAAPSPTAARRR